LALEPFINAIIFDLESMIDFCLDEERPNGVEHSNGKRSNERCNQWNNNSWMVHKPLADPVGLHCRLERKANDSPGFASSSFRHDFDTVSSVAYRSCLGFSYQ
jgi:hypothetical protein